MVWTDLGKDKEMVKISWVDWAKKELLGMVWLTGVRRRK